MRNLLRQVVRCLTLPWRILQVYRRALAAEEQVKELKAAIGTECRRCTLHSEDLGRAEDNCRYDTCPLWPYKNEAQFWPYKNEAQSALADWKHGWKLRQEE